MSYPLPPRPSLEQLKNQAKELLKAHRKGDSAACDRLRRLRRLATNSAPEILSAKVTLADMQFLLAQDYGFESWGKLKAHVERLTAAAPSPARRARIAGIASAREDMAVLARTRLHVVLEVLPGRKLSREVVTDDVGRFEIPVEWEGPSAVEIFYHALADGRGVIDGYLSEGTADRPTPLKVVDGGRYEMKLSFPDGYSLEVTVTDPDGREVEGAGVALSLFMADGESIWPLYQLMGHLTTDAAGRAVVPGLWATPPTGERFVVAVEHGPYCDHLIADPEDLPRPGGLARAAVRMQRGVSLRVRAVSEADGTPIVGAKVCVFAPVDLGRGLQSFVEKSGFTAADGECEVGGLRSGDYGVFVTGKGFLPARQEHVPVGSVEQAELKMISAGRIRGHVLDQQGNPVSGASIQGEVSPVNGGEPFMDTARTDALGAFALESLPKGRRALVSASLHEAPHTFFGAVAADTTDSDITLDARARVRCTLRVRDAKTNMPVADVVYADIVVEPDKGHVFYRAEAANGDCSFPLVPGMESEITAHDSFLPNDSRWFATARLCPDPQAAGQTMLLELAAVRGGRMRVRLVDARTDKTVAGGVEFHQTLVVVCAQTNREGIAVSGPLSPLPVSVRVAAVGYKVAQKTRVDWSKYSEEPLTIFLRPIDSPA